MTNSMNKIRVSYSTLKNWEQGRWQEVINHMLHKVDQESTPQMQEGTRFHQEWANYINRYKTLPGVFGSKRLSNPKTEIRMVANLEPWLDLSGVIDCLDEKTVYEFKTGIKTSEGYASLMQTRVYGLLCSLNGIEIDRAIINHYNQYLKESDSSMVWITERAIEHAKEWAITIGSEIYSYFSENGLFLTYKL